MIVLGNSSLDQNSVPSQLQRPDDVRLKVVSDHHKFIERSAEGLHLFFGKVVGVRVRFSVYIDFEIVTVDKLIDSFEAFVEWLHQ